jgi:hypothetical protein
MAPAIFTMGKSSVKHGTEIYQSPRVNLAGIFIDKILKII